MSVSEHSMISSKELSDSFRYIYTLLFGFNVSMIMFITGILCSGKLSENLYLVLSSSLFVISCCLFGSIFLLIIVYGSKAGYNYGVLRKYLILNRKKFFKTISLCEFISIMSLFMVDAVYMIKIIYKIISV